jgi:nicotinamidase-related amidase
VSGTEHASGAVLLCLDMQPVFVRVVADGARILRRCQFAVAAAARLGIPVAFTEQVPEKLGPTDPELLRLVAAPEVHAKKTFSACAAPAGLLSRTPAQHLLLCGVETPVCVYQTAVDALQSGLPVTVLADCVGARRPDDARVCLEALARAGAHILPAETVFYAILGAADHPAFRSFTELVKTYG